MNVKWQWFLTLCLISALCCSWRLWATDDPVSQLATIQFSPTEREFIRTHPVVRLADNNQHQPFLSTDDGRIYTGYTLDYLDVISELTGIKFELQTSSIRDSLVKISQREIDGLAFSISNNQRRDLLSYSTPYAHQNMSIFTKAGDGKKYKTFQQLNGKRIVITKGSPVVVEFAESIPYAQIIVVESATQLIQALLSGRADYAYYPEVLSQVSQRQGMPSVDLAFHTGNQVGVRFAFRRDWPELTSIVNKALAAIDTQTQSALVTKWLDKERMTKHSVSLSAEEVAFLQRRVAITYCINPNAGEFSSIDAQGHAKGLPVEIMQLVASVLPSQFSLHRTESWVETLEALKSGDCDMTPAIISTQSRREFLLFPQPYYSDQAVVATLEQARLDTNALRSAQNLFAVTSNYAVVELVQSIYPDARVYEVESTQTCMQEVLDKNAVGCIGLLSDIESHAFTLGKSQFDTSLLLGIKMDVGFAVNKNTGPLKTILDKVMVLMPDTQVELLYSRYFGGQRTSQSEQQSWPLAALGVLAIVVLWQMLYVYRERVKVHQAMQERAAMSEQYDFESFIAENLPSNFIVVDKLTTKIIRLNKQGQKSLGFTDLTGLTLFDVDQQLTEDLWKAILEQLSRQSNVKIRSSYRNSLGFIFPTEVHYTMYKSGKSDVVLVAVADISRRVQAEQELHSAQQKERLFLDLQKEFSDTLSKQIKSPISKIVGLLTKAKTLTLTPTQQKYIDSIDYHARSAMGEVNAISDFSLAQNGFLQLQFVEFDLIELIQTVIEEHDFIMQKHQIDLLHHYGSAVGRYYIGDSERLKEILQQLIAVSIESAAGGEIMIDVEQASAERLRFKIKDTGVGFTDEQVKRLLANLNQQKEFERNSPDKFKLQLCQQLIELMDGKLSLESVVGVGCEFSFEIHLPRAYEILTKEEFRQKHVLVVDDNKESAELIQSMLALFGVQISFCDGGENALLLVKESPEKYDLVLLDWNMRDLNGIETAQLMRQQFGSHAQEFIAPPCVVMVSAQAQEYILKSARQAGVDLFLAKPVEPSALFDTLIKVLIKESGKRRNHIAMEPDVLALKKQLQFETGRRILLVEDNVVNQDILLSALDGCNIDIEIANNGQEALNRFDPQMHELILMDLQMPIMDGYEAAKRIREHHPEVPIVALTANVLPEHVSRTKALGFVAHLAKPLNLELLYQTLIEFLSGEQSSQEHKGNQTQPAATMPMLDTVNTLKGLARFDKNSRLYCKALLAFADKYAGQNISELSFEQSRQLLHTVKDLSDNLGLERLQHATMQWELKTDQDSMRYFTIALKAAVRDIQSHREQLLAVSR